MQRVVLFALFLKVCAKSAEATSTHLKTYPKPITLRVDENADVGEPLILTPYIVEGDIERAQKAAQVNYSVFKNITHYTGFFTVNATKNSNLFMWFFPSENSPAHDPVLLWLQGGPGGTSLFGLFTENGPFKMKSKDEIVLRNQSWTKYHNVLYIDNPVQTGFSFTDGGLAHDEEQIGRELYEALRQFFLLFPNLRKNQFFITGESYAGHYIPVIADTIRCQNIKADERDKINLVGLAIGDGWTDPVNQLEFGDYLYQHGIVDENTKKVMNSYRDLAIASIKQGEYERAGKYYTSILTTLRHVTKIRNFYNYLFPLKEDDEPLLDYFVQKPDIRKAIHVGKSTFHDGTEVEEALNSDFFRSVVQLLPNLLDNYRVLLYSGQVDIIVAYPLTINYLKKLNFSAAAEYKNASRTTWFYKGDIAGFVKVAGNLTDLLVRNAGHMVPTDQPDWAFDMIYKFTRNLKFD